MRADENCTLTPTQQEHLVIGEPIWMIEPDSGRLGIPYVSDTAWAGSAITERSLVPGDKQVSLAWCELPECSADSAGIAHPFVSHNQHCQAFTCATDTAASRADMPGRRLQIGRDTMSATVRAVDEPRERSNRIGQ